MTKNTVELLSYLKKSILYGPSVPAWLLYGYSGFFPLSKEMHVILIGWLWMVVCLSMLVSGLADNLSGPCLSSGIESSPLWPWIG